MPNRIGQQLGNYRLLRLLGRGGFAEVYLGEHVFLKRRAALKVLYTSLEDEDIDLFLSEAQLLARLNHSHIVRVHDFAVEETTPYLAMDYAPGGSLRHHHPRGCFLSLATTATYVNQVAEALHYAHNHQVIHRDVKPENMLVGANQEVLLSDFGISLFTPSQEQLSTQNMMGTLPYMAPEQIRGKPCFASDQYALGIVVYEWLCGVRPFEGSVTEVMVQQLTMPPPALREKDPSLPEAVEAVVLKALAKEPQDRFGSVVQFAQALEEACATSLLIPHSVTSVTAQRDPIASPPSFLPHVIPVRVFVSSSPTDHDFVVQLKTDLHKRGIIAWDENPYLTQDTLEREESARQVIRSVDVVLVILSPAARSSRTVKAHLRIASLYQRRVLFLWATGDEISAVLPGEWSKTDEIDLIDARKPRYAQALEEVVVSLHKNEALQSESVRPESSFVPRNPYKGLNAFQEDDATDFFGREVLTQELVEQVKRVLAPEHPERPPARLLAVLGPSGSGKSSMVMAGLVPRLRYGAVSGSEQWVYLRPVMPGSHALEALALPFTSYLPERSIKSIREDLEDESTRGLHLLASQLVQTPGQQVVLFIDQFEELFTLTGDEAERQQFIDLLVTAMTEPHGAVIVLLTLRADFYDRPMAYPALHQLMETHQKAVLPMSMADLRAVIKGPAALPDVHLSFEGNLVGDLLFEMQGQAGALPLLQFTLEQLFERRSDLHLTLAAYHEIGGVRGAVAKHAETTYISLPSEEHRKLARALFLRLIDPGETAQDTTRRRITHAELVLSNPKETVMLEEVTHAFTAARLLTSTSASGIATVEVSHEAVIREWTRLAEWLDAAREDVHRQQTISEDASEWEQLGKPRDRLYRGTQLNEAQTWAKRNTPSWGEAAFLRASASRQKRSRISLVALGMLIILLVIPAGLLLWQIFFPPNATTVTNLADSGPGSLRQAIDSAKAGGVVTFEPSLKGAIKLTSNIDIGKDLNIRGPGEGNLSIVGNGQYNVIQIEPWATVSISDLAFNGTHQYQNGFGIIINNGILTITNVSVSGNTTAGGGGGISNNGGGNFLTGGGGSLTIKNSIISGNASGEGWGGGIGNYGGSVTIVNSIISKNTAFAGAGIFNNGGPLTIMNTTISDNTSGFGGYGGGILNVNGGTLTLTNSLVFNNQANNGWGGGINNGYSYGDANFGNVLNQGGPLKLTNTTISNNLAAHGGGMILNRDSQASITFCTMYGNTATFDGGGVAIVTYNASKPSQVVMRNTLLAMNKASSGPDVSGMLTSDGYNLIQNISGATFIPNKQHLTDVLVNARTNLRIDPVLGGRMPQTHALLPGSPAIDRIPLDACHINGISTDQLGNRRPDGNEKTCDIGAFESSG